MLRTRIKLSVRSGSNLNLEALVFGERGKPEHPEKNLSARQRNNNKPTLPYTHKGHYREYLLTPPPPGEGTKCPYYCFTLAQFSSEADLLVVFVLLVVCTQKLSSFMSISLLINYNNYVQSLYLLIS